VSIGKQLAPVSAGVPTEGAYETPMTEPNQIKVLSRDHELLRMLGRGCSNEEIATFLNVSPLTVKKHLQTLFLELGGTGAGPIPGLGTPPASEPKAALYGLPCSKCHAYYPTDMPVCPICKSPDRVSPNAVPALPVVPAIATPVSGVPTSLAASRKA
jgi:regulatory LuxR family protein